MNLPRLKQISESGLASILIALGCSLVLGAVYLGIEIQTLIQSRQMTERTNRQQAFYTGEAINWHAFFRASAGLPPVGSPDSEGKYPVSIESRYDQGIPASLPPSNYLPSAYVRGDPLNIKTTMEFDSARTFTDSVRSDNLWLRRPATTSDGTYCGIMQFPGNSRRFHNCFWLPVASTLVALDPDGPSGSLRIIPVAAQDWIAGTNILSKDFGTAVNNFISGSGSTTFTTYYQSRGVVFLLPSGDSLFSSNSSGSFEWSLVARIQERVTSASATGSIANAVGSASPSDFVRIYYQQPGNGTYLSGTGFNDGTLIASGTPLTSSFNYFATGSPPSRLDNIGANAYPGILSLDLMGSASLTANITFADSSFFIDWPKYTSLKLRFDTSKMAPFDSSDPSNQFFDGTTLFLSGVTNAPGGSVNGKLPGPPGGLPDMQFEGDASQSFQVTF